MEDKQKAKPTCAVRGMVRPGAVCSKIIVGMQYCGYAGECPHKQEPAKATGSQS